MDGIFDTDFLRGFAFGQSYRSTLLRAYGKPLAYLYGGIHLPELTVWDKAAYPHAAILAWEGKYYLTVSKSAFYKLSTLSCGAVVSTDGEAVSYKETDGAWVACNTATVTGMPVWAAGTTSDSYKQGKIIQMYDVDGLKSYNGMVLPGLPDYDSSAYPYATMWVDPYFKVSLWLTNKPQKFNPTTGALAVGGTHNYLFSKSYDDGYAVDFEWRDLSGKNNSSLVTAYFNNWDFIVWANYDIKNSQTGAVWLESSEPVPLSEVNRNE